ncbi:hypothetical protein CC86DRAFT_347654 [Ophiobolus disseminans]|uniref:Uncharacterized protein n=1 Tax=Ophiobolus disseminans TaxID=1469910 RepID=A0A6A7A4V1_9PLEO|nr:hypothetical protein CC86DRAFT_347654 [Ophiobolus disseminans]
MDNTTLHTFLFHCPAALRTLVLLGSWDNFARPYPLELDARRGRKCWRGIFTFSDIICDGDLGDLALKRDGPLRMGGTYWYYYKVDGEDECHDPSEPSTTFCPLLPGQRLNVLELPSEGHSRSNSAPCDGFTRNPSDRFLNPVPPAPLNLRSPRLGTASAGSSPMPPPSPWVPRSATYPPPDAFLSPDVVRHARSASASPHIASTPMFADFRVLKEKLASKRSASRSRSSSKSQELEIGNPVLVSSTTGDLNLIPLASYRAPLISAPRDAPSTDSSTRSIPTIRREFSPLGSHPVDPIQDSVVERQQTSIERKASVKRRRSHVPSTVIKSEFKLGQGRVRANSADTRRTQHYIFSNDPWLSSPKLEHSFEANTQGSEAVPPLPTLHRPTHTLAPPTISERPTSSHSGGSPSLRLTPSDKDLPELPRYLKPAPLFACNDTSTVELPAAEPLQDEETELEDEDEDHHEVLSDLIMEYEEKPTSHFSTWSNDSMACTCSTPDADAVYSPTFSSLTSNCSDEDSPQRLSLRYSYAAPKPNIPPVLAMLERDLATHEEEPATGLLSPTLPTLDDLRISTFGTDLFNLDIQHADSAPRRQAACFGLGFHYTLPEDDATSKTTLTESTFRPEPSVQRDSSMSHLTGLVEDFGYLGDSVI